MRRVTWFFFNLDYTHCSQISVYSDSFSTVLYSDLCSNVIKDKDSVINSNRFSKSMVLHGNETNMNNSRMGLCNGVHVQWHPKFISFFLSLALVSNQWRVAINTSKENAMKVEWKFRKWNDFKLDNSRLHICTDSINKFSKPNGSSNLSFLG